jgi:hypothetical protein
MRAGCVVALGWVAVTACNRDPIKISPIVESTDYGQAEVEKAASEFAKNRASPDAYRKFREQITTLRPRFNGVVREAAERYQVFLAETILTDSFKQGPRERAQTLALTVWPIVLGVDPNPGEAADDYIERYCLEVSPKTCGRIVPEHRSLVVNEKVWDKMYSRAREALRACVKCKDDVSYHESLGRLSAGRLRAREELQAVHSELSASAWPQPGRRAETWQPVALLAVGDDRVMKLDGQPMEAERIVQSLSQIRDRAKAAIIGVHLRPKDKIETLDKVIQAARKAGFREVLLQAREHKLPYDMKGYRLKLAGGGSTVSVRSDESVQALVNSLDDSDGEAPRLVVLAGRKVRLPSGL